MSADQCRLIQLGGDGNCRVDLCPSCRVVHLHLGPLSLKLPVRTFRGVCEVLGKSLQRMRDVLAEPGGEIAASGRRVVRH